MSETPEAMKEQILDDITRVFASRAWIPVTDRLPEMGERVMVCNAVDEWVSIGHRHLTGAYLHWDGDDHEELHEPTHWMSLPELPEAAE